jgi:hypothetical protein
VWLIAAEYGPPETWIDIGAETDCHGVRRRAEPAMNDTAVSCSCRQEPIQACGNVPRVWPLICLLDLTPYPRGRAGDRAGNPLHGGRKLPARWMMLAVSDFPAPRPEHSIGRGRQRWATRKHHPFAHAAKQCSLIVELPAGRVPKVPPFQGSVGVDGRGCVPDCRGDGHCVTESICFRVSRIEAAPGARGPD